MLDIPELNFTEQELRDYMSGEAGMLRAIEILLARAERTAEEFCDMAQTDRENAVAQGMLRVAMRLHETFRGAPGRYAALAKRKPESGTSPGLGGFV